MTKLLRMSGFQSVSEFLPMGGGGREVDGEVVVTLSNEGIGNVLSWYDDVESYINFSSINKEFNNFLKFQGPRFAKNIRFKLREQPTREFLTVFTLEITDLENSVPPNTRLFTKKDLSLDISVFPNLRKLFVMSRIPVTLVSFKLLKNITHLSIGNQDRPDSFILLMEKSNFKKLRKELLEKPIPQGSTLTQAYEHMHPIITADLEESFKHLPSLLSLQVYQNALVPRSFINQIPKPLEKLNVIGSVVIPNVSDYRFSFDLKSLSMNMHQLKDSELKDFLKKKEEVKKKKEEEEEEEEGEGEKSSPSLPSLSVPIPDPSLQELPSQLTFLSLIRCDEEKPVDFSSIGNLTSLEHLELRLRNVSSTITDSVFTNLLSLQSLKLRCYDVTGKTFNCPDLHTLEIQCPALTDDGFIHMKILRFLRMIDCKKVRGHGFKNCSQSLIRVILEEMNIFESSVCVLRSTRTLHLISCNVIKDSGADFGNLTNVRELIVDSNPDISDYILVNMKKLEKLHLLSCPGFKGDNGFTHLENLKELRFSNNSRIDGNAVMASLDNLRKLTFIKIPSVTNEGFENTKFLKVLVVSRSKIINETCFKHLMFLRHLELEYCEKMGSLSKKNKKKGISNLRSLYTLVLSNMTNVDSKFFKWMPGVLNLSVSQCKGVTGKGLVFLKELEVLKIEACIKFNYKNSFKTLKKIGVLKELVIRKPGGKNKRLQKEIETNLGSFLNSYKIDF